MNKHDIHESVDNQLFMFVTKQITLVIDGLKFPVSLKWLLIFHINSVFILIIHKCHYFEIGLSKFHIRNLLSIRNKTIINDI